MPIFSDIFSLPNFPYYGFEVRQSRCVLNYHVESKCENRHKHNCIWYVTAGDGGWLTKTMCFGHHGGHRQFVHTTVDKLIKVKQSRYRPVVAQRVPGS